MHCPEYRNRDDNNCHFNVILKLFCRDYIRDTIVLFEKSRTIRAPTWIYIIFDTIIVAGGFMGFEGFSASLENFRFN